MANELRVPLMLQYTGLTLLGKVFSATAQVGSDVSMTEIGTTAVYSGNFSLTGVADGAYSVRYDTATKTYGHGDLYVLNETVVTPEQYALATSIAALNDFDPTVEDVNISSTSEDSIVDKVWDEPLTGATHNNPTSAGRRLRQASAWLSVEGSLSGTHTLTSIQSDLTNGVDNFYNDQTFVFVSGDLQGQARLITSYNSTTKVFTFDEAFTSIPSDGDEFAVFANHEHPITQIQAGLATSAQLNTAEANIIAEIDVNETKLDSIQERTDRIPDIPSSRQDIIVGKNS